MLKFKPQKKRQIQLSRVPKCSLFPDLYPNLSVCCTRAKAFVSSWSELFTGEIRAMIKRQLELESSQVWLWSCSVAISFIFAYGF